ncbi:MAG: hypothetical protein AAFX06_03875 [Planctomycetota bacterium]
MFDRDEDEIESPPPTFGLTLPVLFLVAAMMAWWRLGSPFLAGLLVVVSVVVGTVYRLNAPSRIHFYRLFRRITGPIQRMATLIALALIYYLLFMPIGWCLRLFGRGVRTTSLSDTMWQTRQEPADRKRYFETY